MRGNENIHANHNNRHDRPGNQVHLFEVFFAIHINLSFLPRLELEALQTQLHDFVFEYSCRFCFWVDLHDSTKLNTVYSRRTHFVLLRYTVFGMFICRFLRRRLAVDLSLRGKRCRSVARLWRLPRPRKDANAKPDFSLWRPHRRPIYGVPTPQPGTDAKDIAT